MKILKILHFSFFIVFTAVIVSGCSDSNPTNPGGPGSTINVTGKVVNEIGAPISGVTVVIGGSTSVTTVDGSFTINGVTTPYNARLVLASGTNPVGISYEGLTSSSPQLYGAGLPAANNTAKLTVSIPALLPNQQAQIFFADNGYYHYFNTISIPETSDSIRVNWTGSPSITGKIVVLVYTFAAGQIASYNKYGEKLNYVLNNGSSVNESFSNAELSTDPGEVTVSGSIVPPAGYTTPKAQLMLKFSPTGTIATGARIDNEILSNTYSFVVPTGIPSAFTIGIDGRSSGPTGGFNQKIITVQAGSTGNTINLIASANLSTPPNGATGIDTNTNFTFTTGSAGITLVSYNGTGRQFIIITGSNTGSATIPSFSAYGLGLGSSVNYSWSVSRLPNITSVDAFVNVPIYNNVNYNELTQSESRNFTSAP